MGTVSNDLYVEMQRNNIAYENELKERIAELEAIIESKPGIQADLHRRWKEQRERIAELEHEKFQISAHLKKVSRAAEDVLGMGLIGERPDKLRSALETTPEFSLARRDKLVAAEALDNALELFGADDAGRDIELILEKEASRLRREANDLA